MIIYIVKLIIRSFLFFTLFYGGFVYRGDSDAHKLFNMVLVWWFKTSFQTNSGLTRFRAKKQMNSLN